MVFNFIFILIELSWFLNLNHEFNKLIQVNFLYRVAFLWKEFYSLFLTLLLLLLLLRKKVHPYGAARRLLYVPAKCFAIWFASLNKWLKQTNLKDLLGINIELNKL